jgi:uncharacterized protein
MPLLLHAAFSGLYNRNDGYKLTTNEYAEMINGLFPWYVKNRKYIRIDTLDYFVRSLITGKPSECTFADCFGSFFSICPGGDITSCWRFAGDKRFVFCNVYDNPSIAKILNNSLAFSHIKRQKLVEDKCADKCNYYSICHGGCYYDAITSGDSIIDPHCSAFQEIYNFLQERLLMEMQLPSNIEQILLSPPRKTQHPLFRTGPYISLADEIHPTVIADNARTIISLYELGKLNDPSLAAQSLYRQKLCGNVKNTKNILAQIKDNIHNKSIRLNNLYIHVTFNCNLRCTHCYANAGKRKEEMSVSEFEFILQEAIKASFRQIVITGGEPLFHAHSSEILDICRKHRHLGSELVLRTNLTGNFDDNFFYLLSQSVDEIVVSVDGNSETHNERRGDGTYEIMLRNLEKLSIIGKEIIDASALSLTCVLSSDRINGVPGRNAQEIGEKYKMRRIRFRPILPLGRAESMPESIKAEGLNQYLSLDERLKQTFKPANSCGIGQNLYIEPSGNAYPCYAWCGPHTYIGNVLINGLKTVLEYHKFVKLRNYNVDTIDMCHDCPYRYLCGGLCRAWGSQNVLDLNTRPAHCHHLQDMYSKLTQTAMEYLLT